jgi:hypothetical protein
MTICDTTSAATWSCCDSPSSQSTDTPWAAAMRTMVSARGSRTLASARSWVRVERSSLALAAKRARDWPLRAMSSVSRVRKIVAVSRLSTDW